MIGAPNVAEIAALVGDPGRVNMMAALFDGRALTATELAFVAGISAATASEHLAKLVEGRLLTVEKQGRHRYFRLAGPLVAQMLEGIMAVAAVGPGRHRPASRIDAVMREARTCYDHLAGRAAVAIADTLVERHFLLLADGGGELLPEGRSFLQDVVGIDLDDADAGRSRRRRIFCRPCLDWSERRPHLAGALGACLCRHALDHGWARRLRDSRALDITRAGRTALARHFGVVFRAGEPMRLQAGDAA